MTDIQNLKEKTGELSIEDEQYGYPFVAVALSDNGKELVFYCIYCNTVHKHGAGNDPTKISYGHRQAHCQLERIPYPSGYYLVPIDEQEREAHFVERGIKVKPARHFKLERIRNTIVILDARTEKELAVSSINEKNVTKTSSEIIQKINAIAPLNGKTELVKQDIDSQLVSIYIELEQTKENEQKEKEQKKAQKEADRLSGRDSEPEEKKNIFVMKHYFDNKLLYESVKIAGKTAFVAYDKSTDGIKTTAGLEYPEVIYSPIAEDEPMPFTFESIEELRASIEEAKRETWGSLYYKAKTFVIDYCDIEPNSAKLLAGDIVFTYCQDKIGMTHYLLLIGFPNTGKGAMLELAHQLAYRAVLVASATSPSIFRTLGTTEPGQATILVDEANNLTDNEDLQTVLKTGYKLNGTIPRVLDGSSATHTMPTYFKTFCWKMIAAEDLKAEWKALGFLTRCFRINTYYGIPNKKIDQVITRKNPERAQEHDKLIHLRKLLFAYRLLHYSDPIPNIKLNIDGRDEEICLPLLSLFKDEPEALEEIRETLSELVIEKQSDRKNSFEAYLYERVKEIIAASKSSTPYEIEFATIWNTLKELLQGTDIEEKPQSMQTSKFGELSKRRVSQTIQKFGAKPAKDDTGNKRTFRLNQVKFDKFAAMYTVPDTLEINEEIPTSTPVEVSENPKHETDTSLENKPLYKDLKTVLETDTSDTSDTCPKEVSGIHETDTSDTSDTSTESKAIEQKNASPETPKADMVNCPYCKTRYSDVKLVIKHSVNAHPGKPVTAELEKRGYKVD